LVQFSWLHTFESERKQGLHDRGCLWAVSQAPGTGTGTGTGKAKPEKRRCEKEKLRAEWRPRLLMANASKQAERSGAAHGKASELL
jgi:hypothetical protein